MTAGRLELARRIAASVKKVDELGDRIAHAANCETTYQRERVRLMSERDELLKRIDETMALYGKPDRCEGVHMTENGVCVDCGKRDPSKS